MPKSSQLLPPALDGGTPAKDVQEARPYSLAAKDAVLNTSTAQAAIHMREANDASTQSAK